MLLTSPFRALSQQKSIIRNRLSTNPIAYRLASGAFWSLVGMVCSKLLSVVATVIVARLLGKEAYGAMGMVISTMGVFSVFAGFGLGSTSTKYIAEYKRTDPAKAGRIYGLTTVVALLTSGIMAVALLLASPYLATHNLNRPDLAPLVATSSILLFLSTMQSVQTAALSGFEAFRQTARITIVQGAAAPVLSVPLVWFYGIPGAISAFSISSGLGLVLCSYELHKECRNFGIPGQCNRSIWQEWPTLWHFSLPALIAGALVGPVTWISNTILAKQPGGYGELGLFNAANQWRSVIVLAPGILSTALLPVLSESHGKENKQEFQAAVGMNFRLTLIVSLPITLLLVLGSKPLELVFGRQFNGTAPSTAVLMCSCFISIIISPIGSALSGSGRMWSASLLNFCWAASLIIFSYLLVPGYLALGLAYAYLLSYLLFAVYTVIFADVRLSLSIVRTHGSLILFSFLLLGIGLYASLTGLHSFLLTASLLVVSLIPLWRALAVIMPASARDHV